MFSSRGYDDDERDEIARRQHVGGREEYDERQRSDRHGRRGNYESGEDNSRGHGESELRYERREEGYGRESGREPGRGDYGREDSHGRHQQSDYGRQGSGRQEGYGRQESGRQEGYGRQESGRQESGRQESNYGRQESGYGREESGRQQVYDRQESRQDSQGYQRPQGYPQEASSGGRGEYSRPPGKPQSFGVDGYEYQYSNCNGSKKALLIGINYTGTANQLNGCVNDCNNVQEFLLQNGFSKDNIVLLNDQQTNKRSIPTRDNILDGVKWLVKDARANDSLFFHYSGHGGQTPDKTGDEADGNDEVIYPLDFETAGFIDDDTLHEIMVNPLPKGTRLTALFDSCHSGSVLDLPYTYSTKGVIKEPNLLEEAGSGLLDTFKAYSQGNQKAVVQGIMGVAKSFMNKERAEKANEVTKQTKTSPADVITLSGCKDDQTSADAKENGQATGAMSYSFLKVMRENPKQSYLSLLNGTRDILALKYSQKPQLSSSHPIDTNLQFIF